MFAVAELENAILLLILRCLLVLCCMHCTHKQLRYEVDVSAKFQITREK